MVGGWLLRMRCARKVAWESLWNTFHLSSPFWPLSISQLSLCGLMYFVATCLNISLFDGLRGWRQCLFLFLYLFLALSCLERLIYSWILTSSYGWIWWPKLLPIDYWPQCRVCFGPLPLYLYFLFRSMSPYSPYFWTHFTHFALTHICTNRFFKWLNRWLTSPGPFLKRLSKSLISFFPIRQNFFSLIITILTTFCVKLSEYISFLLLISTLASLVLIFLTRILFLSKLCLALRFCDFLTFAKKVRINSCKRYFLKLSLNLLFFHFIFCYLIFAFFINFSFIKLFFNYLWGIYSQVL